ncbi:MAG: transposase [Accumulibacter sp.]|uniref:transposase n=1 Tax=Accumulibacter sp. TaxID=2053492 RepID=UPI002FC27CF7
MILSEVLERFTKRAPIGVMARAILERVLSPTVINQWFDRSATRQYTRKRLFSTIVDLMAWVVCRVRPSRHAAYPGGEESLEGSLRSRYEKVERMETGVSEALVRHTAQELRPVIEAMGAELPAWVPGYRVKILDGNHLAGTEHRLKPLRMTRAGALPGQARVILDPQLMLASEVVLCEDGHAQERSLTERILARAKANEGWVADRHFCTTAFLFGFAQRQADFVIRQHATTLKIDRIGESGAQGRTDTGLLFAQAMTLKGPRDEFLEVRRVTVKLDQPTRDGEWEIPLLTHLPAAVLDAGQVASLSRRRWTVETAFQELEATLEGKIDTLGYPNKAALFTFCLARVSDHLLSMVKAALRAAHGEEVVQQPLSSDSLAEEIAGTRRGLEMAIPDETWGVVAELTVIEFAALLKEWASHARLAAYRKPPVAPGSPAHPAKGAARSSM